MTRVVVSQPMFFPWVGLFEQVRLADVYVHYDDVQFSRGFINRVQIPVGENSTRWLTVPLLGRRQTSEIRELQTDTSVNWHRSHLDFLRQAYGSAPYRDEMLDLVDTVYRRVPGTSLVRLVAASMDAVCDYFGFRRPGLFSSDLGITGSGSARLVAIVEHLGGEVYVTGHGAGNYLDHDLFESRGIRVEYMNYRRTPYPQLHPGFDPHVSVLDLIANVGADGREAIASGTTPWRDFVGHPSA